jgi:hypothetical protein
MSESIVTPRDTRAGAARGSGARLASERPKSLQARHGVEFVDAVVRVAADRARRLPRTDVELMATSHDGIGRDVMVLNAIAGRRDRDGSNRGRI